MTFDSVDSEEKSFETIERRLRIDLRPNSLKDLKSYSFVGVEFDCISIPQSTVEIEKCSFFTLKARRIIWPWHKIYKRQDRVVKLCRSRASDAAYQVSINCPSPSGCGEEVFPFMFFTIYILPYIWSCRPSKSCDVDRTSP